MLLDCIVSLAVMKFLPPSALSRELNLPLIKFAGLRIFELDKDSKSPFIQKEKYKRIKEEFIENCYSESTSITAKLLQLQLLILLLQEVQTTKLLPLPPPLILLQLSLLPLLQLLLLSPSLPSPPLLQLQLLILLLQVVQTTYYHHHYYYYHHYHNCSKN